MKRSRENKLIREMDGECVCVWEKSMFSFDEAVEDGLIVIIALLIVVL